MNEGGDMSEWSRPPDWTFAKLHLTTAISTTGRASTQPYTSVTDEQNDPVTLVFIKWNGFTVIKCLLHNSSLYNKRIDAYMNNMAYIPIQARKTVCTAQLCLNWSVL